MPVCKICKINFKRSYSVTLHLKTQHKDFVQKAICPVCKRFVSNMANLRVHLSRLHKNHKITKKAKKMTKNDVKWTWVRSSSLVNGRHRGDQRSERNSSTESEENDAPMEYLVANGIIDDDDDDEEESGQLNSPDDTEESDSPMEYFVANGTIDDDDVDEEESGQLNSLDETAKNDMPDTSITIENESIELDIQEFQDDGVVCDVSQHEHTLQIVQIKELVEWTESSSEEECKEQLLQFESCSEFSHRKYLFSQFVYVYMHKHNIINNNVPALAMVSIPGRIIDEIKQTQPLNSFSMDIQDEMSGMEGREI